MRYTNEDIKKRAKLFAKIKSIIGILIYSVILLITIFNITLLIKSYVKPSETPDFFGLKTYVIASGSMRPDLNVGDIIIVKTIAREEAKIGDVISFRQNDSIITHRIINVINGEYQTKGDYNNSIDPNLVQYEDIEGKCVFVIPYLGKIVFALKNKLFIIIVIILIYFIYMHDLKKQTKKEIRKEKRKNLNSKRRVRR